MLHPVFCLLCLVVNDTLCYICRFIELKEQHDRLCLQQTPPAEEEAAVMDDVPSSENGYVQDVSADLSEDSKPVLSEAEREVDSERSRTVDETSHKNRSKRESRRMRELEQAQFSLELLKVRTTSMGGPVQEDSSMSQLEDQHRHSPRGSPASHGSFELLSVEDMETEGSGGSQEHPQALDTQPQERLRDSNFNEKPVTELPDRTEGPKATFYIPSDQSPIHEPKSRSPSRTYKERRESTSRRPVVVLISMQKESPVEEGELLAAQTLERALDTGAAPTDSHMTPIAGLEVSTVAEQPRGAVSQAKRDVSAEEPPPSAQQSAPDSPGVCSSEVDIQIVLQPKDGTATSVPAKQERKSSRPGKEAPSPVLDTKPPKAQKKSSAQTVIVNMVEKPSNSVFSPPRRKLPFSK